MKRKITRHRGGLSRLRGGQPPAALQKSTLQPTSVPPSGLGSAGLHGVAGLWRPTGVMFVRHWTTAEYLLRMISRVAD